MTRYILLVIFLATSSHAQQGMPDCQQPDAISGAEKINPFRISQRYFSALVGAEVSYRRCLEGLPPVAENASVRMIAEDHAKWMSDNKTLTHEPERPGYRKLSDRFARGGLRYRRIGENLALVSRFKVDQYRRFRVNNAQACSFSTRNGRPIGPHSYTSLARYVVDLWMKSPGHARNLLNPTFEEHGAAVKFDPHDKYCGRFYISQNFRDSLEK